MSSKGKNVVDSNKNKGSAQSRKNNRRRSQRHASISNGDQDESKERAGKRSRDNNKDSNEFYNDEELYKSVIDLVPNTEYNCCPAENPVAPGTLVNLHGVILHETQGGLIVLNVRWRNQVYSGALIDIEKTKWASERISTEGNSELSKFNAASQPPIKKLRIPTSTLNQHVTEDSDSGSSASTKRKGAISPTTPSKSGHSKARAASSKKRNSGIQDAISPVQDEVQITPKKSKVKGINGSEQSGYECPEPNCGKKYKNKNGLAYHQKHQHVKKAESFEEKETKSDESDSGEDNFVIDEKAGEGSGKEEEEDEKKDEPSTVETNKDSKEEITTNVEVKNETEESRKASKLPEIKEEVASPSSTLKDEKSPVKEESKKIDIKVEEIDSKDDTTSVPSSIHVVRSSAAPLLNSGEQKAVPSQPPNIIVVKTEEDRPRSGSSQIIIHGDHENSLKELFLPPTQNLNQYSPTLSNLNPQKINQNMTEVLNKKPTNSVAPLIIARMDSVSSTITTQSTISKTLVTNTLSMEVKPNTHDFFNNQQNKIMTYGQNFLSKPPGPQIMDARPKTEDVDCSDSERSVSPENILSAVHRVFPQKERGSDTESKPLKGNILTSLGLKPGLALGGGIRPFQAQETFEKSLISQELASKVSSEAASMSPQLFSSKMGPVPGPLMIDQKISPQILRSLSSEQKMQPSSLSVLLNNTDKGPLTADEVVPKQSLLHQRLLGHDAGNVSSALFATSTKHQPNQLAFQTSRPQLNQKIDVPTSVMNEFRLTTSSEKISVTTSLTLSSNRMPEKLKTNLSMPSGLRINPPPEERHPPATSTIGWQQHPEAALKDMLMSNQTASSQYRVPLSKSISMSEMQIFANSNIGVTTSDTRQKMLLKRTTPTIPIAPAPTLSKSNRPPGASVPTEYTVSIASSGARDHFEKKFTMTSDKRLVPSPAENRGRPKKIRVVQTELTEIPIGTVQEAPRSRATPDSQLSRSRGTTDSPAARKVTSPVVRASVIQGSLHSGGVQTSLADHSSPPKKQEGHMFQMRNQQEHVNSSLAEERARFAQQVKMASDARIQNQTQNVEKYGENMKSPPGMYYSQQRRLLSPPTSRSPTISPRSHGEVHPRSPPSGFPHDMTPPGGKPYLSFGGEGREKFPFPMSAQAEHVRNLNEQMRKQDIHRSISEPNRPGNVDSRKSVLSPRESGINLPPSFSRTHHEFEKEYSAAVFGRHQSPRAEAARSSLYEHRGGSHDESDQARMMARERYLIAPGLPSQPPMFRNTSPPPTANVPSTHSSNLALGRADGSILTKLPSSYESRTNEPKR